MQCAHGISRARRAVRFDGRNAFCLCRDCHTVFTYQESNGHETWNTWLKRAWGEELFWQMHQLAGPVTKLDYADIMDLLKSGLDQRGQPIGNVEQRHLGGMK